MNNEPCKTCKYKETAGEMVDPCFPCLLKAEILTGTPKRMFDRWEDDKMTWEQIEEKERLVTEKLSKQLDNDPEFKKAIEEIVGMIKEEKQEKNKMI